MKTSTILSLATLATLAAIAFTPRAQAAITLFNLDFSQNPSDFESNRLILGPTEPGDFNSTFQLLPTGGNPDHRALVTQEITPNSDTVSGQQLQIQTDVTYLPVTYNPAVSGTIDSITFTLDVLPSDAPISDVAFTIQLPNGAGAIGGYTSVRPSAPYSTIQVTLHQSDFSSIPFDTDQSLQFGFSLSTITFDNGQTQTFDTSFDNFSVSVTTATPEPASLAACGLAVTLLPRRRGN